MADVEMKETSSSKMKAVSKAEGSGDGKKKFEVKKV
jgi:RING-box protein 1